MKGRMNAWPMPCSLFGTSKLNEMSKSRCVSPTANSCASCELLCTFTHVSGVFSRQPRCSPGMKPVRALVR